MAITAANFYVTHEAEPSLFEVIASKNLQSLLQPALEKLVCFVAEKGPKYLQWASLHSREVYLLINGSLQLYYLNTHGASFAEHFYGLKRLKTLDEYEISKVQKVFSWISLVLGPYLRKIVEEKIQKYKIELAEQSNDGHKGKLKRSLVILYSILNVSWGLWSIIQYISYMSGKMSSQLPELLLLNIKLAYCNQEEDESFWKLLFRGALSFEEMASGLVQNGMKGALQVSSFLVQFLQVWNTEKSHFNVGQLPTSKAPQKDPKWQHYQEKCPICLQKRKVPTVLPVSGYVFCFGCIYRYLCEHGHCPVTQLPAEPLDIVRLYA